MNKSMSLSVICPVRMIQAVIIQMNAETAVVINAFFLRSCRCGDPRWVPGTTVPASPWVYRRIGIATRKTIHQITA